MASARDMTLARPHEPPLRRKIAAIMAADVAGYSRLVAEAEEETLRQLGAAREVFDGLVERAGGRIFNTAGDSVMCEFDSAVEAVRVAIDIQESLASQNAPLEPRRRLQFRIGLTIGDVVERDGDLLGDGVNIAARLESLAPPGGICVSRSVHEAVANKISVEFRDIGQRQVKNMPQSIHAFVVEPPRMPEPDIGTFAVEPLAPRALGSRRSERTETRRRPGLLTAGTIVLALVVGVPSINMLRHRLETSSHAPANLAANQAPAPSAAPSPEPETKPAAPSAPFNEAATPAKPAAPAAPATAPAAPAKPAPKPARAEKPALPADPVAALAALSKEGIVAEPNSVAELYHNARLQEAKDRPAALRSYAALMAKTTEYLDVDLRYAALTRSLNGAPAARSTFAELSRGNANKAPQLVAAIQAEPEERRAKLEAMTGADSDYAPAWYFLAEDYLAERQGGPTLTERRLAFDALDSFLDASAGAKAQATFLDKSVLTSWREAAQKRAAEIETAFAGAKTRPSAAFSRADTGWTVSLTLPEPALAVSYRVGDQGEFQSTGVAQTSDPRTGKPAPRTQFEIPAAPGRTTLYITYTDGSGHVAGPFPIQFDPAASLVASQREALEKYPDAWVRFRADIPDLLAYTQLVTNRCAITHALIGYGDAPPKQELKLPPCDMQNPYAIPANARSIIDLPPGTDAVQLQLSYADGTESPVRSFHRP